MRSPRLFMLSAATGAALALTSALATAPASGSVDQQDCDHTAISLSANPASPVNGATSVTITAHVTDLDQPPLTPVGTVTFTKDTTTIASPAVDGAGNASTNTFMSVGFHHLAATFTGGTTNNVKFCDAPATTISYLVNNTTTTTTPAPTTTPTTPPPSRIVYQTCAVAFAAGVHDLRRGIDRGYRAALDRDGDGIACELNGDDGVRPTPPVVVPGPRGPAGPQGPQGPAGPSVTGNGPTNVIVVPPAPAQTFTSPQAPSSGAVATGDGSLAGTA